MIGRVSQWIGPGFIGKFIAAVRRLNGMLANGARFRGNAALKGLPGLAVSDRSRQGIGAVAIDRDKQDIFIPKETGREAR